MKNKYMYIDSGLFQLEIPMSDGKSKFMDFFWAGGVLFNRKECFAQSDSYNLLIHQNEDDSVIWYSRT